MSYSTATSILILLPGLPQTTTSSGYTATSALIEQHISRADNVVNGKIVRRYDIKNFVTSVPPLLRGLSEDIASYFTYRSLFSSDNQNVNEWTEKFRDAIVILDEVNKGTIDLVNSSGDLIDEREISSTEANLVDSSTLNYQSFFDIDDPTSWNFDADLKSSVEDAR